MTAALLAALLKNEGIKEVKNIHQDTWTLEESESSQDSYKNQLTGSVYRMGVKTMGDVTVNFTIGQYDFVTKAEFLGGTVSEDGKSWERARGTVNVQKCLIALTVDDVYVVIPKANINAYESNTDGAVGIAVKGTMLEPEVDGVAPEYWFLASEVSKAQSV